MPSIGTLQIRSFSLPSVTFPKRLVVRMLLGRLLLGASCISAQAVPDPSTVLKNSIEMRLVKIPAGSFAMGSSETDRNASANEKPRRQVTISKPFYRGQFEVTQGQWEAVMGTSAYALPRSNPYYALPGMAARLRKPTNPATVGWNDAQEFIRRLNEKEGHRKYRLPTEAEWEYAARAGTSTAYSFGDDDKDLGRYAWFGEDFATGSTRPVGEKRANPWGLHDVHGNVWEWVQDWYDDDYYARGIAIDPVGPASGSAKVVRGGSWHVTSGGWRSAIRKPYDSDYRGISIGFRLVRDIE